MKRLSLLTAALLSLAPLASADKPFYSSYDVKIALETCLDLDRSELLAGDAGTPSSALYSKCERAVGHAVKAVDPYVYQDGYDFILFEHLKAWEETLDALQEDVSAALEGLGEDGLAELITEEREAWDDWAAARCARDTVAEQAGYGEPAIDAACRIQLMAHRWRDETHEHSLLLQDTKMGRRDLPVLLTGGLTGIGDGSFLLTAPDGTNRTLSLSDGLSDPFPLDTEFRVFAHETPDGWIMADWTNVSPDAR